MKIGINGFGRIGRAVFRICDSREINIVAINDIIKSDVAAHLLKYDSVFGKFEKNVKAGEDFINVNGKIIKVTSFTEPKKIPWKEFEVDIVVESTGRFVDRESSSGHIEAGAKKVIISAPAKKPDITIVMGVNENNYDSGKHHIISNASCTTNCFAMLVKVLHENFKIKRGELTTIHSYTNDQRIVDSPHKDLRRARAAAMSIIPTSTGAGKAIYEIFPELNGKLTALAIRIPTPNVSVCDFSCELEKKTSKEEINSLFKKYSEGELKNYLLYSEDPIVSVDVVKDTHSAVFDSTLTDVVDGNFAKVFAWYDNEWGYSSRIVDIIEFISKL